MLRLPVARRLSLRLRQTQRHSTPIALQLSRQEMSGHRLNRLGQTRGVAGKAILTRRQALLRHTVAALSRQRRFCTLCFQRRHPRFINSSGRFNIRRHRSETDLLVTVVNSRQGQALRAYSGFSDYQFRSSSDKEQFERELHTINVAVLVNLAIFIAKLAACYLSKSSSLLAEAIHSLADVGNQVLLRTGVLQALKGPTKMYNYGHSREKFVWSLISAVGVFFLGAGVSLLNGIQGIWNPRRLEDTRLVFYVLGASFLLEGYSLLIALRTVMKNATAKQMRVLDYIILGKDPTPIAVVLEDSGAVLGIIVASICLIASQITQNAIWDSIGSVVIGLLMGGVATFLIRMNRSFLIGRSINAKEINLILKQLKEDPVVKYVHDCKSEEIAPGKYRFKAEIDFSGSEVVKRHLQNLEQNWVYDRLRHASWSKDNKALQMALKDYGAELVSQVGVEVDKLEEKIRQAVPGVMHVDLEVDRGKIEKGLRSAVAERFQEGVKHTREATPSAYRSSKKHSSKKNKGS